MKKLNKLIVGPTFLAVLFISQSAIAGDEGIHDEYSGHPSPSLITESTQPLNTTRVKQRVNYSLDDKTEEALIHAELFPDGNR